MIEPPPHQLAMFDLPEHCTPDPIADLRSDFLRAGRVLVAIDDDPTGTQTTSDASLVTAWELEDLEWLLDQPSDIKFVLTNSRSMAPRAAAAANRTIGERVRVAAEARSLEVDLVSRSDSTLRGHFPHEVFALAAGFGLAPCGIVLMPFFAEGGRLTIHGTHYVHDGERLTPVGSTPFAKDRTFGFTASDLRSWVEERSAASISADDVHLIDIDLIRQGGPAAVHRELMQLAPNSICVCDAVEDRDARVVATGIRRSTSAGRRWILRSAASLLPALVGREPAEVVPHIPAISESGGLIVVGSHVPLTTRQLEVLMATSSACGIEVEPAALISDPARGIEIARVSERAIHMIESGRTTVVSTSRSLHESDQPLVAGERIASGVCAVVAAIIERTRPAYIVAKGGITSHSIATDSLGARRSRVIGPIAAGVPMWEMGAETRVPGLTFVVFPGNVGDERTLAAVVEKLERVR